MTDVEKHLFNALEFLSRGRRDLKSLPGTGEIELDWVKEEIKAALALVKGGTDEQKQS